MVIVDANVLLYAVNEDAPHHEVARTWLDGALAGSGGVGFPWVVLLAFLRIATNPRILPAPMAMAEAVAQVGAWLAAPPAVVVEPTTRHLGVLGGLLDDLATGANLVNDAHLAALAIERDAHIVSFDRDFARFDGVRHQLPS